jgi:hypothetical protein
MNQYSDEYKALEGLFFWCKIAPKVRAEQRAKGIDERYDEISKQFELFAQELDKLKVPWRLQNAVAYAATKPENQGRYFANVLKEILAD